MDRDRGRPDRDSGGTPSIKSEPHDGNPIDSYHSMSEALQTVSLFYIQIIIIFVTPGHVIIITHYTHTIHTHKSCFWFNCKDMCAIAPCTTTYFINLRLYVHL